MKQRGVVMSEQLAFDIDQLKVVIFSFLGGLIIGFTLGILSYKQFLRSIDAEDILKPIPYIKYLRGGLAGLVLFVFIYLSIIRPTSISTGLTLISLAAAGIIFGLDTVEGVATILRGEGNNDNE